MARDPNCVFCKIVSGQIPAATVYEARDGIAFLDVGPLADGHLLWVPKEHYDVLDQVPADIAGRLCEALPRLGAALRAVTGADGYNVLQNNGRVAGQEVPHVHFHLIPRAGGDGLGYRWNAKRYGQGRMEELAGRLRSALAAEG